MPIRRYLLLLLILSLLTVCAQAQVTQEAQKLESGKPIERELAGGESPTGGSGANGKEVEGFGVLAQRQGAKAVVASLWPVGDRSTKELMQDFYRLREAKAGTSKAEALRQAQLTLLRGGKPNMAEGPQNNRQIVRDEEKSPAPAKPLFKLDPNRPYAHPYYWAPFILIGNWK